MTATQVQFRRGTAAQMATFTGASGEVVVDTTNSRIVVHDGSTAGGWPAAKLSELSGGFVNKFRNGALDVWQRGASAITVSASGAYTADGWIVTPTGASCTAQQVSNNRSGANTLWGLGLIGASGVTDINVRQRIESVIAAALAGKTVTIQAQIYNNTGASITPTLATSYPTATDNWASLTGDLAAANLQTCANGQWTQIAYTLSVSANAVKGYAFVFDFGNNFSSSAKNVIIAEIDVRVTPGAVIGLNSDPPLLELRPIAAELLFCERYYQQWLFNTTAVITCAVVIDANDAFGAFVVPSMRDSPTVTLVAGPPAWIGAGTSPTYNSVTATGPAGFQFHFTGTFTNGNAGLVIGNATTPTVLSLSAEL